MALASNTVWEVRSATGSDTNGGAFVTGASGTDYSQQTSPQYTTNAATTSGTTTVVWSAAAANMVGNICYIAGGTGSITGAWYQIVSVSAGVSIIVDNSTGLTTGTGVTVNVGGALATLTQAITNAAQANTIYCKGSQTVTSTVNVSQGLVNTTAPTSVIGYSSTRGDSGKFTLQTSTNNVTLITFANGAGQLLFINIIIKSTAGTPGDGITSAAFYNPGKICFDSCQITGCNHGMLGDYTPSNYPQIRELFFINCEIDHNSYGIRTSSSVVIVACYIHDNTNDGISTSNAGQTSQGVYLSGSVLYNNGANGIYQADNTPVVALNCAFVNNTTSGFNYAGTNEEIVSIINCIFYGNGNGISFTGSMTGVLKNNAYGANSTNKSNVLLNETGTITLTADPFTNRTGGDFTLNSTSGGGAACKSAGYQSTIV